MSRNVQRVAGLLLALQSIACSSEVGDANPEVRVLMASASLGCFPVNPADASFALLRVAYTNSTDVSRVWDIDDARLELSGDGERGTVHFPFIPNSSGLVRPGETLSIEHVKPPATGTGSPTCSFCGGARWEMFVTWSTSDRSIERRVGSGDLFCTS